MDVFNNILRMKKEWKYGTANYKKFLAGSFA